MSAFSNSKCILGFDFGMKHIGVATGQLITNSTTPQCELSARDGIPNWQELDELISQWLPQILVVGLPLHMDGSIDIMAHRAKKFGHRMKERYHLPCYFIDERLSTYVVGSNEHKTKQKKQLIHAESAAVILQTWINETA